jgi:glycosyltransferase involved in cell wall biosynthesis
MAQSCELTLVIPTYNERDNIAPLLAALRTALGGIAWEALFVDDSADGTDRIIAEHGETDARVRLLRRTANHGGLGGAVVEGFGQARGEYICVLDADLQHPPEKVAVLLATARRTRADAVIASRYLAGGSAGGLDGSLRQAYSRGLRLLSRFAFPMRLRGVTDPLGGFFLVRSTLLNGVALRPVGYKILLEVLVRCRPRRVREVPYRFQPRRHGESKASFREGVRFLRHLATLLWQCSPGLVLPRLAARRALEWRAPASVRPKP